MLIILIFVFLTTEFRILYGKWISSVTLHVFCIIICYFNVSRYVSTWGVPMETPFGNWSSSLSYLSNNFENTLRKTCINVRKSFRPPAYNSCVCVTGCSLWELENESSVLRLFVSGLVSNWNPIEENKYYGVIIIFCQSTDFDNIIICVIILDPH